jgi:hypothetical protein
MPCSSKTRHRQRTAGATAAQAATVFSDNFNADSDWLNATSFAGGWSVTDGTVDIIGRPAATT